MSEATRKKIQWTLDLESGVSTALFPSDLTLSFDNSQIYAQWAEMDYIAKKSGDYGVRQKLADKTAPPKGVSYTDEERRDIMSAGFAQLLDGDWTSKAGPREGQLARQCRLATDEQLVALSTIGLDELTKLAEIEIGRRASLAA